MAYTVGWSASVDRGIVSLCRRGRGARSCRTRRLQQQLAIGDQFPLPSFALLSVIAHPNWLPAVPLVGGLWRCLCFATNLLVDFSELSRPGTHWDPGAATCKSRLGICISYLLCILLLSCCSAAEVRLSSARRSLKPCEGGSVGTIVAARVRVHTTQ